MPGSKYSKSFSSLLTEGSNSNKSVGVNFKGLLTEEPNKSNRKLNRVHTSEIALIFDLNGDLITKAKLKNMSNGGMGFELPISHIAPNTEIQIVLGAKGRSLGLLDGVVKWVSQKTTTKKIGVEVIIRNYALKSGYYSYVTSLAKV